MHHRERWFSSYAILPQLVKKKQEMHWPGRMGWIPS
jgi:hypothetical protein